jgi:broad specificity phosphatase PhoE
VVQAVNENQVLNRETIILSSDFRRARETAKIVYDALDCQREIEFDIRLRERFFGDHDKKSDTAYSGVWQLDRQNPHHTDANVESVCSVLTRGVALVNEIDTRYKEKIILLVSHGDILQILQTAFASCNASLHRDLDHLETAEIRLMALA